MASDLEKNTTPKFSVANEEYVIDKLRRLLRNSPVV